MISDSFFRNYNNAKIHKIAQNQKIKLQVLYAKTINKIFKSQRKKQKTLNTHNLKANSPIRQCQTSQAMFRYTDSIPKSESQNIQEILHKKDCNKKNVCQERRKIPIMIKQIIMSKKINNFPFQSKLSTRNNIFTPEIQSESWILNSYQNKQKYQQNSLFIDCPLKSVQILEKTKRQKQKQQDGFVDKDKSITKQNYLKKEEKKQCIFKILIPKLNQLKEQKNSFQKDHQDLKKSVNKKTHFMRKPRLSYKFKQNIYPNQIINLQNSWQSSLQKSVERGQRFTTTIKRKFRKTHNQCNHSKFDSSIYEHN